MANITKTMVGVEIFPKSQPSSEGRITLQHFNNESYSFLRLAEENVCRSVEERKVSLAEIIACIISILTVVENLIILIAIIKGPRSLRKPPYWFIASLAASDMLTGFEVLLAIFVPVGTSASSRIALKGIAVVTFIISINSLLLVSLDRYLRIARHADYETILTRKTITILILVSWLISIGLFLIIPLLGWSCSSKYCCANDGMCVCKRSEFGSMACYTTCSQSFVPFTKSYILTGVIYFVVSIVAMISFYIALFRVVKKKTFSHRSTKPTVEVKPKKREMQLAKTLIITLGAFVVCWLPVMALFLADIFITYPTEELAKVFDFALVPSVVNSLLNPIIYSIRLPHMRNTIKSVAFSCIFGGKKSNRYLGATWATNTSIDQSGKRQSKRRHIEKSKVKSLGSCQESNQSNIRHTNPRLTSTKSINSSDTSSSTQSSNR